MLYMYMYMYLVKILYTAYNKTDTNYMYIYTCGSI